MSNPCQMFQWGRGRDLHRLEEPRAGISDKKEGGAEDKGGGGDVWIEGKGSMGKIRQG